MANVAPNVVIQLNEILGSVRHWHAVPDAVDPWVLRTRLVAALTRLAPRNSPYSADVQAVLEEVTDIAGVVERLAAIAQALLLDYQNGYISRVEELVHAELFSDFFDMAKELLGKGYKDAAAVIAGSVLEEHLRKVAQKRGVAVLTETGKPRNSESLNEDLGKSTYGTLEQKSVTAWLDLRNNAAHGHYDKYDHRQVAFLIDAVRDFAARHPA